MATKTNQLDPRDVEILMSYVLEHYLKHHDAVSRKLGHARAATKASLNDAKSAKSQTAHPQVSVIKAYDRMWEKIIGLFSSSGISEDELAKIESVLSAMPTLLQQRYNTLVTKDEVLQRIMRELQSEEYQNAIRRTREIQGKPDIMSGLAPREFEVGQIEQNAFMFRAPAGKI